MDNQSSMFTPLSEEEAEEFRADLDLLREDVIDSIWIDRYVENSTKIGELPKVFPGLGVSTPRGPGTITGISKDEIEVELWDSQSVTQWRLEEIVAPWQNPPILEEEEVKSPSRSELLREALSEAGWDEERIEERITQENI